MFPVWVNLADRYKNRDQKCNAIEEKLRGF